MKTPNQILGVRLREAISQSGIPLKIVAHKSGYNETYIRRVKNGRFPNPTITFIWAVAAAIGVSPAWLVGWDQS